MHRFIIYFTVIVKNRRKYYIVCRDYYRQNDFYFNTMTETYLLLLCWYAVDSERSELLVFLRCQLFPSPSVNKFFELEILLRSSIVGKFRQDNCFVIPRSFFFMIIGKYRGKNVRKTRIFGHHVIFDLFFLSVLPLKITVETWRFYRIPILAVSRRGIIFKIF